MHNEYLKYQGMRAQLQKRAGELRLEGKGLIRLLRDILEPFQPDLTRLRLEEASAELKRLREIQCELLEIDRQLRELEAQLG